MVYAVDDATAADSSPIMSATIAHSSQVTYTASDVTDATTAWLTTTLNLRVPRVAEETSLVADAPAPPRSAQPLPASSCHW